METLEDLKRLPTGVGQKWVIRRPLENAGFNVVTPTIFGDFFRMLDENRFATFSIEMNGIYYAVDKWGPIHPSLEVEPRLALYIPVASYYYVSPKNPQLAERIRADFESLIASGKFDKLFYQYHCKYLLSSNLENRLIFKIDNPDFSNSDFNKNPKYWLNPKADFTALCAEQ